jgi:ketosteroid isomerase-like protein
MPAQNVDIVQTMLSAFNRGDFGAFLDMCHPNVEWDLSRRLIDPEIYRGRDGIQKFFEQQDEAWAEAPKMEAERLIDAGDNVVAFVRVHGRGRGSGVEVGTRIAQLWTIQEGKAIRLVYYGDRDEALEAAGLA